MPLESLKKKSTLKVILLPLKILILNWGAYLSKATKDRVIEKKYILTYLMTNSLSQNCSWSKLFYWFFSVNLQCKIVKHYLVILDN
jgi:hypothetical protein